MNLKQGMQKLLINLAMILIIAFNTLTSPVSAASKVELRGGKLSVDLQDMDLTAVLGELGKTLGIEITAGEGVGGRVSLKFDDLPLRQGLESIVGQNGYTLKYAGEGLSKVQVVKKRGRGVGIDISGAILREYSREEGDFLKFYDRNGKLVKVMDLDRTVLEDAEKNLKITENKKILQPSDKKIAVIFTDITYQTLQPNDDKETGLRDGGRLTCLDSLSNIIWEKELPDTGFRFGQSQISRNGDLLFTVSGEIGHEILWIITKSGDEFYKSRKGEFGSPRKVKFSDNWQYMAFYLSRGGDFIKFVNLINNKQTNYRYHTPQLKDMDFSINDDGLSTVKIEGMIKYYDQSGKLIKEEPAGK